MRSGDGGTHRPDRALAEAEDEPAPAFPGIGRGHALLEDDGQCGFENGFGAAEAHAGVLFRQPFQQGVGGREGGEVVAGAAQRRGALEEPFGAVAPGLDADGAVRGQADALGGWAEWGAGGAPYLLEADAPAWVARSDAGGEECVAQIERRVQAERCARH